MNIKQINAHELLHQITTNKEITIINVLDAEYFNDCRIKNSINIHYQELQEKVKPWNRGKNIIVYCASYLCSASKESYKILTSMGFTNVQAYEGGMKEWRELGYPSEGLCKKEYLTQPLVQKKGICSTCNNPEEKCAC